MENLLQKSPLKASSDVSQWDSLQNNYSVPVSVSTPAAAGSTEKLGKLYVQTRNKRIRSLLALS